MKPRKSAYILIFLGRRILFVLSALLLTEWPLVQLNLLYVQSIIVLVYLIHSRPFEDPLMNRLEIFNELSIMVVSYASLVFTGITENEEIMYQTGWVVIIAILINILVNMGVLFI